jgi:hypothetical protein
VRSIRVLAVVVVALAALLAACSSDSADPDGRTATTRPAAPVPAGVAGSERCDFRGSTIERTAGAGAPAATITSAEVGKDLCVDRVAFAFETTDGLPPRYEASYQQGPFNDYNQEYEITPSGDAYLVIRFDKTTELGSDGELVYSSRESIEPADLHHLRELRMVVAPEGSVMFVIGLDAERPFMVDGSASPSEVVIEIG